ncbi:MAG: hypothetical protein VX100_07445 [Pseudomonadota bacterium]|nr:hypothetical protein [Pseudomonadota bacterium]
MAKKANEPALVTENEGGVRYKLPTGEYVDEAQYNKYCEEQKVNAAKARTEAGLPSKSE